MTSLLFRCASQRTVRASNSPVWTSILHGTSSVGSVVDDLDQPSGRHQKNLHIFCCFDPFGVDFLVHVVAFRSSSVDFHVHIYPSVSRYRPGKIVSCPRANNRTLVMPRLTIFLLLASALRSTRGNSFKSSRHWADFSRIFSPMRTYPSLCFHHMMCAHNEQPSKKFALSLVPLILSPNWPRGCRTGPDKVFA